jgi:putative ABC transport system permease protein
VLLKAKNREAMSSLTQRIESDRRLPLKAATERDFYEKQQGPASGALKVVAILICIFMSIGACCASMNTMYASLSSRIKEIGILQIVGFRRYDISIAFILESIIIAILGAFGGILFALPLNFISSGTTNYIRFSDIAFQLQVSPDLILWGMALGITLGFVGALPSAIQSLRYTIVEALHTL